MRISERTLRSKEYLFKEDILIYTQDGKTPEDIMWYVAAYAPKGKIVGKAAVHICQVDGLTRDEHVDSLDTVCVRCKTPVPKKIKQVYKLL